MKELEETKEVQKIRHDSSPFISSKQNVFSIEGYKKEISLNRFIKNMLY